MTLQVEPAEGGCRLRLRVRAGADRDSLDGVHGGALRVRVTVAPEKGKANRRVLELLGEALGLPPSALRLLRGETRPDKVVWIPLEPIKVRGLLPAAPEKT
ncbi:MAG TPA: DUF167 domain-containing protein [Candidatus Polarisedimenticolaceae bacterium]|nr:DUF167 domain-containing protein [Candidatus Polarisedimenticolaceae bacterium]